MHIPGKLQTCSPSASDIQVLLGPSVKNYFNVVKHILLLRDAAMCICRWHLWVFLHKIFFKHFKIEPISAVMGMYGFKERYTEQDKTNLFGDFPMTHLMKCQWLWTGLSSMHQLCLSYRTACWNEHRYSQKYNHNMYSREWGITLIIQGSLTLSFREGSTHAFHHPITSLSIMTDVFPNPMEEQVWD